MRTGVEFRSWNETDRRVLPALFLRAIQTVDSRLDDGEWMDDLHSIDENYGHGGDILVGLQGGDIIAMGGLKRLSEETAEMKRVAVDPELQGQGLGPQLLQAMEERARELGITKLVLDTTDLHVAARKMYERAGYSLVDRREVDHPSGQTYDTFFYEKELPSLVEPLFAAEADKIETGVESTGASQETREAAIRSAQEFRRTLIEDTFKRIKEIIGRESKFGDDRKRFMKTERRRQNYIEKYEERAREWVDELLSRLDPEDETDQAFMTDQLKEIFIALKYRLLIVEMETRRLAFFIYGESTGTKETREQRTARVVYESGEDELDIAELILAEIDGMRKEEKMSDHAIFRQLVRKYHEDVSDMPQAKDITQLIYGLYDAAQQHFII